MAGISRKFAILALTPMLHACSLTGLSLESGPDTIADTAEVSPPLDYASIEVPQRQDFIGQGPQFLDDLFGAPSLRRKESGAEMWQYTGPTCVVLFYLYEEAGSLTIDHFDTRLRKVSGQPSDTSLCLKEMAAQKINPALS
jgi:hypothetical protein